MASTVVKEQYPEDMGDGSLTVNAYPHSGYVTVVGRQDHDERGKQVVYLIVDKQELIDAINKED